MPADADESKQEATMMRAQIRSLEDVNAAQQQQIEELTRQLTDRKGALEASLSELTTLHRQFDDKERRCQQLEKERQEQHVQLHQEQQATQLAMEKSQLAILQGYVLRACDEFVLDCPRYDQPLSSPGLLYHMTKERTARVLNCLHDFAALSANFSDHVQYVVDADSVEQQVQKVYRKLSLLLHSDKLPALIDGERKGHNVVVVLLRQTARDTHTTRPRISISPTCVCCYHVSRCCCVRRARLYSRQGVLRADEIVRH